jgi:hypothetical protein
MNVTGNSLQIEYQESPGVNRIAKLDELTMTAFGCRDPQWLVQRQGETNWKGPFEWLTYYGTDGKVWITKIHAEANSPGNFHIWMESKWPNGSFDNPTFQIVDWGGVKWAIVEVDAHGISDPWSLSFNLRIV